MQFSTTALFPLILALALLVTEINTYPIRRNTYPQLRPHISRRGLPGAVYICTSQNFQGDCGWQMPSTECRIPGTGNGAPESIGPDPGGFCVLYEKATCEGNQVATLRFPGLASGIPTFGGLKCLADGAQSNSTGIVANGGLVGSGIASADRQGQGDPRLSGGVGSKKRKELKDIIAAMEADGFSQGMIGLEKGIYF